MVSGHDRVRVENVVRGFSSSRAVYNSNWAEGLSTSLRVGERHVPQGSGFLIALGDTPLLTSETLGLVLPSQDSDEIVRVPTYEGRRGHPVYVPAWVREHWHRLRGDQGARSLFGEWPDRVLEIPVQDQGILRDFDHPADFIEASPR